MKSKHAVAVAFALMTLLVVNVSRVHAQEYPVKPIKLLLGYPPGGVADGLGRPLAQRLSTALGQAVVVDNRPGAQTMIAADVAAKATPDGYTLYLMTASHVLLPFLMKTVTFEPLADFTPIALLGTQGYVVAVGGQQPFASMQDLAAYGKAHPGALSVGVTDITTLAVAQALRNQAGIDITTVNYKGGGPLMNDVLGGQIAVGIVSPTAFAPFAKDARLRGLGVTMPARLPLLPNLPTVSEALGRKGVDVQNWFVLAGPRNLPPAVAQRVRRETEKILADPEMRKVIENLGVAAPANMDGAAITAMMKDYQVQVGDLLKAAGVTPE
jgi:tripartite-type tricarboxylate transporter receptor subunit TctC